MKMLKKEAEQRQAVEMLCTDMLVPKGHLLRKIDAAVNFARIYDLVEDLYCEDNGRPSCDPVVLFKLVLTCRSSCRTLQPSATHSGIDSQLK